MTTEGGKKNFEKSDSTRREEINRLIQWRWIRRRNGEFELEFYSQANGGVHFTNRS